MIEKPKLQLGVIGGGINSAIGITHKIALKMDERFELAAGCFSRDQQTNKRTAQDWCVEKIYPTYQNLLEQGKNFLDAVVVLTPTSHHAQVVKKALDFNIPVICEKTVTDSLQEARYLQRLILETNGFLVVTYNYTGYPMIRELKDMIQRQKLGRILHVRAQMPQEGFIRLANDGTVSFPQSWRLVDGEISTLSLDLGTHLSSMVGYLTDAVPLKVVSLMKNYGHHKVIDHIVCMVQYSDGFDCQMWYSKSSLGHKNGLAVEIYGEKGSVFWHQMEPEILIFNDSQGQTIHLDRSSKDIRIANQKRYERFKSGHPAGFIEAFANYYDDVYQALTDYKKGINVFGEHVFTIHSSVNALALMAAIEKSHASASWETVDIGES